MMGRRRRTARKGNKRAMECPKRRKEMGRCSREGAARAKPLDALEVRTEHGIQEMKRSPKQEIVESGCLSKCVCLRSSRGRCRWESERVEEIERQRDEGEQR